MAPPPRVGRSTRSRGSGPEIRAAWIQAMAVVLAALIPLIAGSFATGIVTYSGPGSRADSEEPAAPSASSLPHGATSPTTAPSPTSTPTTGATTASATASTPATTTSPPTTTASTTTSAPTTTTTSIPAEPIRVGSGLRIQSRFGLDLDSSADDWGVADFAQSEKLDIVPGQISSVSMFSPEGLVVAVDQPVDRSKCNDPTAPRWN